MFAIASGSDNPNIINYRNAIVNEYDGEKAVRRKEAELGNNGQALEEVSEENTEE